LNNSGSNPNSPYQYDTGSISMGYEEQMRNNMMCWLLLEKNDEEKNPVND
jgi:hypothetical protein